MNNQDLPQANTNGGAYVNGSVIVFENGLFVGRDYITIQKNIYDFDRLFFRILTKLGCYRSRKLKELTAFSKGRCLERWLALGIPDEKATSFLNNPAYDRSERIIGFNDAEPLKILIGDFGVGKSLIVETLFQRFVDEAEHDNRCPIPIYIPSSQLSNNLILDINNESSLIGNVNHSGARVIIDGADEIPTNQAEILLQQAIIISKANPRITIIITSRPNAVFERENLKKYFVPELSNDEILAIVTELSEHEELGHLFYGLPQSIVDALKKPFFAILYGLYRRQLNQGIFKSKGELISHLVAMAVKNIEDPQALDLLEKLAVLSIRREGKFIPASDIGSDEKIKLLLKSRIVIARQNLIGFALPILAQWFASKSIENNKVTADEITSNLIQIEKWRYPLMILASNASFEKVSQILKPIAEKHPGTLPEIIDGAINDYGQPQIDNIGLPTAREMGKRISQSMQALSNGLGPLVQYLSPVTQNGNVAKIGVYKSEGWFCLLWYGDIHEEGVVELPDDFGFRFQRGEYSWSELIEFRPGVQSAWVWRFSLDELKKHMRKVIDNKFIILREGYSYKELMWKFALQAMGRGNLSHQPIIIKELRERLIRNKILITALERSLLDYINNLETNGESYIAPLWPGPDRDRNQGSWIWSTYSPERRLERQRLVLEATLTEYVSLVEAFFQPFKEKLTTYLTLPAKLTGYLSYNGIQWYFDPLLENDKSSVDIRLSNKQYQLRELVDNDKLYEKLRRMRPRLSRYYGARSQMFGHDLFGPTPVTHLIYEWLSRDLRDISWIN